MDSPTNINASFKTSAASASGPQTPSVELLDDCAKVLDDSQAPLNELAEHIEGYLVAEVVLAYSLGRAVDWLPSLGQFTKAYTTMGHLFQNRVSNPGEAMVNLHDDYMTQALARVSARALQTITDTDPEVEAEALRVEEART